MSQVTNQDIHEEEVDLKVLLSTLWDFKDFIIRVTILFGVVALLLSGFSYVVTRSTVFYEAESIVGVSVDGSVPRQKQAYLSVLSSQASINAAISNLQLTHDISQNDVMVREVKDTNLIKVTVKYPDATDALVITNAIVNQSIMIANDILNGVNVSSREMAMLTDNTTSTKDIPNIIMNVMIALILGLMGSVFIVFFMEYLMGKVKTVQDIEKRMNVEVLTTLPYTQPVKKQGWWPWKT